MNNPVHTTLAAERRKARHYGMQALYQWHMAGAPVTDIEAEFRADYDFSHVDLEYFQALLHGIPACADELDAAMEPLPTGEDLDEVLSRHVVEGRRVVCLRPGSGFTDVAGRALHASLSERGHACETLPGAVWPDH